MRLMTWNVNGIKSLLIRQKQVTEESSSIHSLLHSLESDIICFQEFKLSRSKITPEIALVHITNIKKQREQQEVDSNHNDDFDVYISCSKKRQGYSGVATYCKHPFQPIDAVDGFTSILTRKVVINNTQMQGRNTHQKNHYHHEYNQDLLLENLQSELNSGLQEITSWTLNEHPPQNLHEEKHEDSTHKMNEEDHQKLKIYLSKRELTHLDSEGRVLITDFNLFVLFNVYFPTDPTEKRFEFKMKFSKLIEKRVNFELQNGRNVMLVGDVNAIHLDIDHCDLIEWLKDRKLSQPRDNPIWNWFHSFLYPQGPMVDVYRHFYPDKLGAFTCWNTLINARESNYGQRIDFILCNHSLLEWIKDCQILQDITGSDHCPVIVDFHDTHPKTGEKLLNHILQGNLNDTDEQSSQKDTGNIDDNDCQIEMKELKGSLKSDASPEIDASRYVLPATCTRNWEEFSKRQGKILQFIKRRQTSETNQEQQHHSRKGSSVDIVIKQEESEWDQLSTTIFFPDKTKCLSSKEAISYSQNTFFHYQQEEDEVQALAKAIEASLQENKPRLSSTFHQTLIHSNGNEIQRQEEKMDHITKTYPLKKKQKQNHQQKSIMDFLASKKEKDTTSTSSTVYTSMTHPISIPTETVDEDNNSTHFYNSHSVTTISTTGSATNANKTTTKHTNMMTLMTEPTSNSKNSCAKETWKMLMTPKQAPLCYHGEESKQFTVNKQGPNKGRQFYLCSRPVGPGYKDNQGLRSTRLAVTSQNLDKSVNISNSVDPFIDHQDSKSESNSVGNEMSDLNGVGNNYVEIGLNRKRQVLNEYRCDYFQWAKGPSKNSKK